MSVVAQTSAWRPYVTPSNRAWPTKVSLPPALRNPVVSLPARDPHLTQSHASLDRLAALRDNWDGHGSRRPTAASLERARQLLEDAFRITNETTGWQAPHISASEDGEIVFEWWNGSRKVTIYVGDEQSSFLKSWGPHVVDEMSDGLLVENWDPGLWVWLFE